MTDEELALLLHQELNAGSLRRRGRAAPPSPLLPMDRRGPGKAPEVAPPLALDWTSLLPGQSLTTVLPPALAWPAEVRKPAVLSKEVAALSGQRLPAKRPSAKKASRSSVSDSSSSSGGEEEEEEEEDDRPLKDLKKAGKGRKTAPKQREEEEAKPAKSRSPEKHVKEEEEAATATAGAMEEEQRGRGKEEAEEEEEAPASQPGSGRHGKDEEQGGVPAGDAGAMVTIGPGSKAEDADAAPVLPDTDAAS